MNSLASAGFGLTEEQRIAIESSDPSLVVSAAAGSGKTRVLVDRYLKQIVENGYRPDQILAITFTRKAAAEMKRRIVDSLTAKGLDEEAQIAETGPIQTIHGFCERLLRENSIAAAIDPDFEILSESQAARLMEESIQEAFAFPGEEGAEAHDLLRKMAGRRTYTETLSPHARLEMAVREAISGWRGTGQTAASLLPQYANPIALQTHWRRRLLEAVGPDIVRVFQEDHSKDGFALKLANAYKALRKGKPRFIRPSIDADIEAAKDTCGLMQLACEAWQIYERKLHELQKLDFIALEATAVALMKRSPPTRARIRAQYASVLVDESQDLNPVQYDLLSMMEPQSEMFVGDRQQSIYGFRQADVQLFAEKMSRSTTTRLSKNHRSSQGIQGFVDHLFGALWGEEYVPMLTSPVDDYQDVELWVQPQADKRLTAEWIRDLVYELGEQGRDAREVAILVRKSKFAGELLRKLEAVGVPARVAGGAEQFYARLEIRDVANALEALTDQYDDFALLSLLRSPCIGLSLDAIVLLAEHVPIFAQLDLFSGLDFPEWDADSAKISKFLEWFVPLSEYADRLSACELIGEFLARSPYLQNLARREGATQRLANLRKLLSLASNEPETGPREFAERIREIQSIRHKEGDAPAVDQDADEVTIMTIHKSKGLEFPVVVLPDTHEKLTRPSQDVEVEPKLGLITTKFGRASSMFHEWLAFERQRREEAEEWRVMYVALTRAKGRLCVVVNPGGSGDRIADRLCRLLKYRDAPPPGITIREAKTLRR